MPFAITLPDDDDEANITRVCAREKGARRHDTVFEKQSRESGRNYRYLRLRFFIIGLAQGGKR